jgi:formylglycine-generating enzyme required for sulfatase activity
MLNASAQPAKSGIGAGPIAQSWLQSQDDFIKCVKVAIVQATATYQLPHSLNGISGSDRVRRGGSWFAEVIGCRTAYRYSAAATGRLHNIGFRCALTPGQP